MDILILIFGVIGFAFAIIVHEVSHGLVAERLGDPTARLKGRLTLNPIPHIDLFGSVILPLTLLLFKFPFLFGWAKPVPIDPYNLRHPKKDMALISLAGPLSNILMAGILSVFLRILLLIFPNTTIFSLFYYVIQFNVALGVFNLLPIGPLDGSKILAGFLPEKDARAFYLFLDRFGIILIMLFILPVFNGGSLATIIITPIIRFFLSIFIPGYSTI